MANTFKYFAYGSNLLQERIRLRNQSAKFIGIGKILNYKLGFDYFGGAWNGATATILECEGQDVLGCVWELDNADQKSLDGQEGVSSGVYKVLHLDVLHDDQVLKCRTYQLAKVGYADKRPSPQYKDVIIRGAKQNGLPSDYIQKIESIEDNQYNGKSPLYDEVLASLNE